MSTTTPRFGHVNNWAQRENGWVGPLHEFIQKHDSVVGLRVKSMTTMAAPGSPGDGDCFWVPPGATGWAQTSVLATYLIAKKPVNPTTAAPVSPATGWYYITLPRGVLMMVEDQSDAIYGYGAAGWVSISAASVFQYKAAVRAVATSNITLSGAQTIDGVSIVAGDRVLCVGQTSGAANGIYDAAAGAWTRSADADVSAEVKSGMLVPVTEGTVNAATLWLLTTNNPITLGSTVLVFQKYGNLPPASTAATPDTLVLRTADGDLYGKLVVGESGVSGSTAVSSIGVAGVQGSTEHAASSGVIGTKSTGGAGSAVIAEATDTGAAQSGPVLLIRDGTNGQLTGPLARAMTVGDVSIYELSKEGWLGLGGAASWPLHIKSALTGLAASAVGRGALIEPTVKAAANNDTLIGVDIAPTYNDDSKTGVTHYDMRWLIGKILSAVANGASAVGFDLVTQALSTAGALALRIKNYTTVLFTLDKDGNGVFTGSMKSAGQILAARVVTAAGAVTVAATDDVVVVRKSSGAATTVNLPASPATGQQHTIKDGKGDAATNNLTITPNSGNIDGAATLVMNINYDSVTVVYDGTEWVVI
jgi:hypothetical protein